MQRKETTFPSSFPHDHESSPTLVFSTSPVCGHDDLGAYHTEPQKQTLLSSGAYEPSALEYASPPSEDASTADGYRRCSLASTYTTLDDALTGSVVEVSSPCSLQNVFHPSPPHSPFESHSLRHVQHRSDDAQDRSQLLLHLGRHGEVAPVHTDLIFNTSTQCSDRHKTPAGFRPARLQQSDAGHMAPQLYTPPNSASSSFDVTEPFWIADFCFKEEGNAATTYQDPLDMLPPTPVVPSQTTSGGSYMHTPPLHRYDSEYSPNSINETVHGFASAGAHLDSSPMEDSYRQSVCHKRRRVSEGRRRSKRGDVEHSWEKNAVILHSKADGTFEYQDPDDNRTEVVAKIHALREGRSSSPASASEAKFKEPKRYTCQLINQKTGQKCTISTDKSEHLKRHQAGSDHTNEKGFSCPLMKPAPKTDKVNHELGLLVECRKTSRGDNNTDHVGHHIKWWLLAELDVKTMKNHRGTDPVSPEHMQSCLLQQRGHEKTYKVCESVWKKMLKLKELAHIPQEELEALLAPYKFPILKGGPETMGEGRRDEEQDDELKIEQLHEAFAWDA